MKLKISTLFHWLYATLMFLPLLMFIPSCFYYGFNEHANANITQDTYLNFYQGVKNGKPNNTNYWSSDTDTTTISMNNGYIRGSSSSSTDIILNAHCDLAYDVGDKLYLSFNYDPEMITSVYIDGINDEIIVFEDAPLDAPYFFNGVYETQESDIVNYIVFYNSDTQYGLLVKNVMIFNLTTIFGSGNEPSAATFQKLIDSEYLNFGNNLKLVSKGHNITDSLNDAFNHLFDLPMFSWTKNSFITAPFCFITGLFGLGSDNSINYLFTYFASISICWLVFDLIMYVPNLAHRWLDRSAIE